MARTIKKGLLSICGLVHDQLRGKKTHPKSITYYPVTLNGAWPIYRFGSNLAGRMYNSVCVMKTSGKVSTQTGHPSPCTPQSGRTYATRGRDGMRRDTRIIQGLVWITRQLKHVKWTGVHLRTLCSGFRLHYDYSYRYRIFGVFGTVTVIIVVVVCRYRFRSYFGCVVPKRFWFRYPTLDAGQFAAT